MQHIKDLEYGSSNTLPCQMAGQTRLEKGPYRAYIGTRAKVGVKATTIHYELYAAYGDQAPSRATIFR